MASSPAPLLPRGIGVKNGVPALSAAPAVPLLLPPLRALPDCGVAQASLSAAAAAAAAVTRCCRAACGDVLNPKPSGVDIAAAAPPPAPPSTLRCTRSKLLLLLLKPAAGTELVLLGVAAAAPPLRVPSEVRLATDAEVASSCSPPEALRLVRTACSARSCKRQRGWRNDCS